MASPALKNEKEIERLVSSRDKKKNRLPTIIAVTQEKRQEKVAELLKSNFAKVFKRITDEVVEKLLENDTQQNVGFVSNEPEKRNEKEIDTSFQRSSKNSSGEHSNSFELR